MTTYRLADHLGVCEVDGRVLMLDLRRDRYLQLDPASASALRRWRDFPDGEEGKAFLLPLHQRGIIVPAEAIGPSGWPAPRVPPRSLVGMPAPPAGLASTLVPQIAARLALTRWRLRRHGLEGAINEVRRRKVERGTPNVAPLVARFRAARRLVPLAPNCLTDSLALAAFLSRRSVAWQLVFGVKLDPFAAHCWLQNDEAVINDAADSVATFTPIMVI
jgi:hypothetical protein